MSYMTPLSEEETAELAKLIEDAKEARRRKAEWLDRKMLEHSKLKPGDGIYDLTTGRCVGKVESLYRYWSVGEQGHEDLDTEVYCDYRYTGGGNTSCVTTPFGTKEDAIRFTENRLRYLKP